MNSNTTIIIFAVLGIIIVGLIVALVYFKRRLDKMKNQMNESGVQNPANVELQTGSDNSQVIAELQAAQAESQANLESVKAELAAAHSAIQSWQQYQLDTDRDFKALQAQLDSQDPQAAQETQVQLQQLQQQMADAQEQIRESEAKTARLTKTEQELEYIKQQLQDQTLKAQEAQAELKASRAQVSETQKEKEAAEQALAEAKINQQQVAATAEADIKQKMSQLQEANANLQSKLSDFQNGNIDPTTLKLAQDKLAQAEEAKKKAEEDAKKKAEEAEKEKLAAKQKFDAAQERFHTVTKEWESKKVIIQRQEKSKEELIDDLKDITTKRIPRKSQRMQSSSPLHRAGKSMKMRRFMSAGQQNLPFLVSPKRTEPIFEGPQNNPNPQQEQPQPQPQQQQPQQQQPAASTTTKRNPRLEPKQPAVATNSFAGLKLRKVVTEQKPKTVTPMGEKYDKNAKNLAEATNKKIADFKAKLAEARAAIPTLETDKVKQAEKKVDNTSPLKSHEITEEIAILKQYKIEKNKLEDQIKKYKMELELLGVTNP